MVDAELHVNLFDMIVYAVLFLAIAISLYRGFIREFMSLLTWFGAGLITLAMADKSTAFFMNYMNSKFGATLVGVMSTYFISVVTLGIFSKLIIKYVKQGAEVGWLDNVLGMIFGLFKGGMVIVLGFILMTLIYKDDGYPPFVQEATTLPTVQKVSIAVVRMMPEYLGSISSLNPEEVDAEAQAELMPAEPQIQELEQGIGQEFTPQQPQMPTEQQIQQGSTALEQLILDVTKNRE